MVREDETAAYVGDSSHFPFLILHLFRRAECWVFKWLSIFHHDGNRTVVSRLLLVAKNGK
jgi:hypothetical protein